MQFLKGKKPFVNCTILLSLNNQVLLPTRKFLVVRNTQLGGASKNTSECSMLHEVLQNLSGHFPSLVNTPLGSCLMT
mgnify:CR=1 FL=1